MEHLGGYVFESVDGRRFISFWFDRELNSYMVEVTEEGLKKLPEKISTLTNTPEEVQNKLNNL